MKLKRSEKPTARRSKSYFAIFHERTNHIVACVVTEKTWTTTSPPVCCNDLDEPFLPKCTESQSVSLMSVQGQTSSSFSSRTCITLQRLEDEMSAHQNHRPQAVLSKDCHQNLLGKRNLIVYSSWLCVPSIHSRFLRQRSQSRYT